MRQNEKCLAISFHRKLWLLPSVAILWLYQNLHVIYCFQRNQNLEIRREIADIYWNLFDFLSNLAVLCTEWDKWRYVKRSFLNRFRAAISRKKINSIDSKLKFMHRMVNAIDYFKIFFKINQIFIINFVNTRKVNIILGVFFSLLL